MKKLLISFFLFYITSFFYMQANDFLSPEQLSNILEVSNAVNLNYFSKYLINNASSVNDFSFLSKKQLKNIWSVVNPVGKDHIEIAIESQNFKQLMVTFANPRLFRISTISEKQKRQYQELAESFVKSNEQLYRTKKLMPSDKTKISLYLGLGINCLGNIGLMLNDLRHLQDYKKRITENLFLSTLPNLITSLGLVLYSSNKIKKIKSECAGSRSKYEEALAISQFIDELPINTEIKSI